MENKINWKELRRKIFIALLVPLIVGTVLSIASYYLIPSDSRLVNASTGAIINSLLFGVIASLAYRNIKTGIIVFGASVVPVIMALFSLVALSSNTIVEYTSEMLLVSGLLVGFAVSFEKKLNLKLAIISFTGFLGVWIGLQLALLAFGVVQPLFYRFEDFFQIITGSDIMIVGALTSFILALTIWTFIWLAQEIFSYADSM